MSRPRSPERQNLLGQIIDHLEVINGPIASYVGGRLRTYWLCRCSCGTELQIRDDNLGIRTHSCGCQQHPVTDPAERFERHLNKKQNGCWEWRGATNKEGFGVFAISCNPISIIRVDKASHVIYKGPVEEGKKVLHKCPDNSCINPDHIFIR